MTQTTVVKERWNSLSPTHTHPPSLSVFSQASGEVGHSIAFSVTWHESNASCVEIQAVPPVVEASLCVRQKEVVSRLPLVCMHDQHFQIRPSDLNHRHTRQQAALLAVRNDWGRPDWKLGVRVSKREHFSSCAAASSWGAQRCCLLQTQTQGSEVCFGDAQIFKF